jgi:hypothetical protein
MKPTKNSDQFQGQHHQSDGQYRTGHPGRGAGEGGRQRAAQGPGASQDRHQCHHAQRHPDQILPEAHGDRKP